MRIRDWSSDVGSSDLAYRVRNQPGNASASLGWSLSWVFDWSDMGRSGWQRARATLSLRPVRMAPATLTAHRFHLFATVFAFATTVALLLPQTRLASQSGTGRPFSVSARPRWRFNTQKLPKGLLPNNKFDNMKTGSK